MIIKLPWIEAIDTESLPENFEELVRTSFLRFTKGTREEYRFVDKLLYFDNLRTSYTRNDETDEEAVTRFLGELLRYKLENNIEFSLEDLYSTEYMEMIFKEGNRPFKAEYDKWSSSGNYRILKTISEIIRIVSNIGDEEQYG